MMKVEMKNGLNIYLNKSWMLIKKFIMSYSEVLLFNIRKSGNISYSKVFN